MNKFIDLINSFDEKLILVYDYNKVDDYIEVFKRIREKDFIEIREEFFKLKNLDFITCGVYEIINTYLIDINNYLHNILEVCSGILEIKSEIRDISDCCEMINKIIYKFLNNKDQK